MDIREALQLIAVRTDDQVVKQQCADALRWGGKRARTTLWRVLPRELASGKFSREEWTELFALLPSAADRFSEPIMVRVTAAQRDTLEREAAARGLSLSAYIRDLLFPE